MNFRAKFKWVILKIGAKMTLLHAVVRDTPLNCNHLTARPVVSVLMSIMYQYSFSHSFASNYSIVAI